MKDANNNSCCPFCRSSLLIEANSYSTTLTCEACRYKFRQMNEDHGFVVDSFDKLHIERVIPPEAIEKLRTAVFRQSEQLRKNNKKILGARKRSTLANKQSREWQEAYERYSKNFGQLLTIAVISGFVGCFFILFIIYNLVTTV